MDDEIDEMFNFLDKQQAMAKAKEMAKLKHNLAKARRQHKSKPPCVQKILRAPLPACPCDDATRSISDVWFPLLRRRGGGGSTNNAGKQCGAPSPFGMSCDESAFVFLVDVAAACVDRPWLAPDDAVFGGGGSSGVPGFRAPLGDRNLQLFYKRWAEAEDFDDDDPYVQIESTDTLANCATDPVAHPRMTLWVRDEEDGSLYEGIRISLSREAWSKRWSV